MTSEKQEEDEMFEIKVPIFCEWTFEKKLSGYSRYESTLYNYVVDLDEEDLSTPQYSLPGFPGIRYYLSIHMEESLYLHFYVEMDYKKYQFDADFTCKLTSLEPQHFVHKFNDTTEDDKLFKNFEICICKDDCIGCPVCSETKMVICVEGIFTVKYVSAFHYVHIAVSDEIEDLSEESDTSEEPDAKDFVIVAEEQEIQVHKSVLAENSTVFARMLDSDKWKETMESKYVIPNLPYKIVKYSIDACYGKTPENDLTKKEEYLAFFQFADQYDFEKLTKTFKNFMAFTPHNVVEYANYFLQNDVTELVNCCIDYILSCSQYSIPIKDIELLDAQIRAMVLDRVLINPAFKKDIKHENRCLIHDDDNNNK